MKAILLGLVATLAVVGLVMWWGWLVDAPAWARSAICMVFAYFIGQKVMASGLR